MYAGELGANKIGNGVRVAVKQSLLDWPRKTLGNGTPKDRLLREISILQVVRPTHMCLSMVIDLQILSGPISRHAGTKWTWEARTRLKGTQHAGVQ